MFGSLFKAALGVVTIPVGVVYDAVTLCGTLTDKDASLTAEAIEDVLKNLKDAAKPE